MNPIKFLTKSIEPILCDYSDAYTLVTGNIAVKRGNAANTNDKALDAITQVSFKNCVPFKDCRAEINDTFVDYVNFINITMTILTIFLILQEVYGALKEMK